MQKQTRQPAATPHLGGQTDFREVLGKKIKYAEAFELCEYGRRASANDLKKLFPFFGR